MDAHIIQLIGEFCGNQCCTICWARNFDVALNCGHVMCEECLNNILENEEEGYEIPRCPYCALWLCTLSGCICFDNRFVV